MKISRFPKEKSSAVIGKLDYQKSNRTVCLGIFSNGMESHDNVDAANDAHSGFIIFNRFARMAQTMPSVPRPSYYSFDAVDGHLYDSLGIAWSPCNPDYDPGPPPPPKPPKPPKASKTAPATNEVAVGGSAPTQVNRPPPRLRPSMDKGHRNPEIGGVNYHSSSSRRSYPPKDDIRLATANDTEQPSRTRRSHGRRPPRRRGSGGGYGRDQSL
jgi:hypothetical protein